MAISQKVNSQFFILFFFSNTNSNILLHILLDLMTQTSKLRFIILMVVTIFCTQCQLNQDRQCQPFGLRLNFGLKFFDQDESQMLGIRFNTKSQCAKSYIVIQKPYSYIAKIPCQNIPVQFGSYISYVHKCSIFNISYGDSFSYMSYGWSGKSEDKPIPFEANFIKTHLLSNNTEVKLVILADWGFLRVKAGIYDPLDSAFKLMLERNEKIDGIYIGGDIAYDLDSYEGLYYQDFIKMLSQVASRWPLILNTGNHQHLTTVAEMIQEKSFQVYGNGFNRLTVLHLPFVSWFMVDPYRIVFKGQDPSELLQKFEMKLKNLNQTKHSKPIITSSHYPYRCNGNIPDCFDVRQKLNPFFLKMMEYNVALYIGGHYHTYQRIYPYYYNQTFVKIESPYHWVEGGNKNYLDNTLLSIVEGIAGNDRQIIQTYPPDEEFTVAYVINNTGFGIMTLRENRMEYDHVINKDPYDPKDHWVMLFEKKYQIPNHNEVHQLRIEQK